MYFRKASFNVTVLQNVLMLIIFIRKNLIRENTLSLPSNKPKHKQEMGVRNFRAHLIMNTKFLTSLFIHIYLLSEAEIC